MISVILPTHNRAAWLVAAIESVLHQTYKNFELIVINDGSKDETEAVIGPYKDKIRYFVQEQQGIAKTRNLGLREAKGDYVAFIDDDDQWLPFKLELQRECFSRNSEMGFLFSDFSAIQNDREISSAYMRTYFQCLNRHQLSYEAIFEKHEPINSFFNKQIPLSHGTFYKGKIFDSLLLGNFINTSTVMLRRSAILEMGGFRETFKVAEDADLWVRLSQKAPAGFLNVSTIKYRVSSAQITSSKANIAQIWANNLEILESVLNHTPGLSPLHYERIRNRQSFVYRKLAYMSFMDEQFEQARAYCMRSLIVNPRQWALYLGWLATWFPRGFVRLGKCGLRKLRRKRNI